MDEFYIRIKGEEEARGPVNRKQLQALVDQGSLDRETTVYDEATGDFVAIPGHPELGPLLFPEKRPLQLKPKLTPPKPPAPPKKKAVEDKAPAAPASSPAAKPQAPARVNESPDKSVDSILQAAEGKSKKSRHIGKRRTSRRRGALIVLPLMTLTLVLMAAVTWLPNWDSVTSLFSSGDFAALTGNPIIALGFVDLALALLTLLGVAEVLPYVRFRAAFGLGLSLYFAWSGADWLPLAPAAATAVGLAWATVSVRLIPLIVAFLLALGGTAGSLYLLHEAGSLPF